MNFTVFGLIAFAVIVVVNFVSIRRARLSGKPVEAARLPQPVVTYRHPEPLPPMWLLGLPCDTHEDCRNHIELGRACAARPKRLLPDPPTSGLR